MQWASIIQNTVVSSPLQCTSSSTPDPAHAAKPTSWHASRFPFISLPHSGDVQGLGTTSCAASVDLIRLIGRASDCGESLRV